MTAFQELIEDTATTTSVEAIPSNSERTYILIQNHSATETLLVKPDSIHTGTEGIHIGPLGAWEPLLPPRNSLWIRTASGTADYSIQEGE
jgi:hypothetical protein